MPFQWTMECTGTGEVQYWLLHGKGQAYMPDVTFDEQEKIRVYPNGTIHFLVSLLVTDSTDELVLFL